MVFCSEFKAEPVGALTLASTDGRRLAGCWFQDGRHFCDIVRERDGSLRLERADDLPVFVQARDWLARYCAGDGPDPRELPLAPAPTAFQQAVREVLLQVPYGQTATYGQVAEHVARHSGRRSSARAVGGAVGRNPVCVIVPCHRVVGADGSLTGFGGGIPRKVALLRHEGVPLDSLWDPTSDTAL